VTKIPPAVGKVTKAAKEPREYDFVAWIRKLAFAADRSGLDEFHVHAIVRDAFRAVHRMHLRRLDRMFDAEFERLRKERAQSDQIRFPDTGSEKTSRLPNSAIKN
jgi:hypothetical protein